MHERSISRPYSEHIDLPLTLIALNRLWAGGLFLPHLISATYQKGNFFSSGDLDTFSFCVFSHYLSSCCFSPLFEPSTQSALREITALH